MSQPYDPDRPEYDLSDSDVEEMAIYFQKTFPKCMEDVFGKSDDQGKDEQNDR
jgi:hypothetical protein